MPASDDDDDDSLQREAEAYLRSAFVLVVGSAGGVATEEALRGAIRRDQGLRRLIRLSGLAGSDDPADVLFTSAFTHGGRTFDLDGFIDELCEVRSRIEARPPPAEAFGRSHTDPACPPPGPQSWSPTRGARRKRTTDEVLDYIEYCNSARMVQASVDRLYRTSSTARTNHRFLRKNRGRQSVSKRSSSPRRGPQTARPPSELDGEDLLRAAHESIRNAAAAAGSSVASGGNPPAPSLRQVLTTAGIRGRECAPAELTALLNRLGLGEWVRPLISRLGDADDDELNLADLVALDGPPVRNPGPRLYLDAVQRQRRHQQAVDDQHKREEEAVRQKARRGQSPQRGGAEEFYRDLGERLSTDFVRRVLHPRTRQEVRQRLRDKPLTASTRERYEVLQKIPDKSVRVSQRETRALSAVYIPPERWTPCAVATAQKTVQQRDRELVREDVEIRSPPRRYNPEAIPTHLTKSALAKKVDKPKDRPSRAWGGHWQRQDIPGANGWLHDSAPVPRRTRSK
eukprot:TRINITY_DN39609_c0_g1_i1.p1 TRINITY_DN39609_c0_g1~~TRINITY_DN39609_c0_g1_i1.p1  ORF type:complete len:513 (+),score=135.77 TRINITY_DN39609_c0_g1_i1:59-1597(+)